MDKKLYVGNLPYTADSMSLRSWFESNGAKVKDAFVVLDRETRRSKGFGFVTVDESSFSDSLSLDGGDFDGRALRINEAVDKSGPRPSGSGFQPRSSGSSFQPRSSSSSSAPVVSTRSSFAGRTSQTSSPAPSSVRFGSDRPPRTTSEFDKPKRKAPPEQRRPKNRKWEDYDDE